MEIVLLVLALGGLAIGILVLISLDQLYMKLSELAGHLATVNTKLDEILVEVSKPSGDPDLPADAQAAVDKLTATVDAIHGVVLPPAPPPA